METQLSPNEHAPTTWSVVTQCQDYALASWNEIVAVVWRHETTVDAVRNMQSAVTELARSYPKGIGMLTVIAAGAPLPGSAARKALADLLSTGSVYIRCSAVIMEGSGFRAATVRSVVTGLTMMSKHDFPHRICDVEGAAQLFAQMLPGITGRALDADTLRSAINELRRQMLPST
jgi:hypothetical protein